VIMLEGEATVEKLELRTYKNPNATRACTLKDPADRKIFEAARETFAQNAVDVFTDCPSRERAGWLCDSFFTGRCNLLFTGNTDLERLFIQNLRSRDIEAQVHGKKRPLYEGRLLDRDIHIADFEVPADSRWMGKTLKQLDFGRKYGVHISSILRGGWRINIPDGDYIIFPGDILQAIGSDAQFTAFREALDRERLGIDKDLEKREMKLRQLVIGSDSPFIGKTLIESGIRDTYSCMVVGLEEGKESLSPYTPNRKFQEGDIIWVVGEQESLEALLSNH